jgi:hypothetical protein
MYSIPQLRMASDALSADRIISVVAVFAPVFSKPVWQHVKALITETIHYPRPVTTDRYRSAPCDNCDDGHQCLAQASPPGHASDRPIMPVPAAGTAGYEAACR